VFVAQRRFWRPRAREKASPEALIIPNVEGCPYVGLLSVEKGAAPPCDGC